MKNIAKDIDLVRKSIGLSQSVFGKIMGINDKTYRSRLKGTTFFSLNELKMLFRYLSENRIIIDASVYKYLYEFAKRTKQKVIMQPELKNIEDSEERPNTTNFKDFQIDNSVDWDALEKANTYNADGQKEALKKFAPKQNTQYKSITTQDKINIKYLANTFGSMGEGGVSYEELPSVMSFDKEFLVNIIGLTEFKNIFIINALGDSMSPSIKDGSKLFINPFENENCIIVSGAVYVIYSPQLGYLVKRVARESFDGSVTLKSDNKDYKDLVITQEQLEGCKIIGRVVGNFDGRV